MRCQHLKGQTQRYPSELRFLRSLAMTRNRKKIEWQERLLIRGRSCKVYGVQQPCCCGNDTVIAFQKSKGARVYYAPVGCFNPRKNENGGLESPPSNWRYLPYLAPKIFLLISWKVKGAEYTELRCIAQYSLVFYLYKTRILYSKGRTEDSIPAARNGEFQVKAPWPSLRNPGSRGV